MPLYFNSVQELTLGPKFQSLLNLYWPAYENWFLSEGEQKRKGYISSLKALKNFMPKIVPLYEQIVELGGGSDLFARFLSCYCPPKYMTACSQVVWVGGDPALIRNYDYAPHLMEGTLLYTAWNQPVIAMIDMLWGVLDGMNQSGLAVSLAFGGSKRVGNGFGIPLILRYILEFCKTLEDALEVLESVPSHMAYNVTLLDKYSNFATAYLHPDKKTKIFSKKIATNHQDEIEWIEYCEKTKTVERKQALEIYLKDKAITKERLITNFLYPPLYNPQFFKGYGTLYTSVYHTLRQEVEYLWPNRSWNQSFLRFSEEKIHIAI